MVEVGKNSNFKGKEGAQTTIIRLPERNNLIKESSNERAPNRPSATKTCPS